jgi:hypothetical protein
MRKFYLVGLALFAVFAFGAMAASSAFAVSKILWSNEEILALLPFQITGELLLEDLQIPALERPDVVCSGIFDGMIEPGGTLAYIEELLMLNGEALNEAGEKVASGGVHVECVDNNSRCMAGSALLAVLNLPWHLEVILDAGGQYLVHFLSGAEEAGKEPEYHIVCINPFTGKVEEDLCHGLSSARLYTDTEGKLRGSFNSLALTETWGAASEEAECSRNGEPGKVTGMIESPGDTETSGGLITDPEGGAFSLSE